MAVIVVALLVCASSCNSPEKDEAFRKQTSEIETLHEEISALTAKIENVQNNQKELMDSNKNLESYLEQNLARSEEQSKVVQGLATRQNGMEEAVLTLADKFASLDQRLSEVSDAKDARHVALANQRAEQVTAIKRQIAALSARERELAAKIANAPPLKYRTGNSLGQSEKWLKEDMELHEKLYGPLKREYQQVQDRIVQQNALLNQLLAQP